MAELLIKYRASEDDDLEGKYQFGDVVRPKCSHLKVPSITTVYSKLIQNSLFRRNHDDLLLI